MHSVSLLIAAAIAANAAPLSSGLADRAVERAAAPAVGNAWLSPAELDDDGNSLDTRDSTVGNTWLVPAEVAEDESLDTRDSAVGNAWLVPAEVAEDESLDTRDSAVGNAWLVPAEVAEDESLDTRDSAVGNAWLSPAELDEDDSLETREPQIPPSTWLAVAEEGDYDEDLEARDPQVKLPTPNAWLATAEADDYDEDLEARAPAKAAEAVAEPAATPPISATWLKLAMERDYPGFGEKAKRDVTEEEVKDLKPRQTLTFTPGPVPTNGPGNTPSAWLKLAMERDYPGFDPKDKRGPAGESRWIPVEQKHGDVLKAKRAASAAPAGGVWVPIDEASAAGAAEIARRAESVGSVWLDINAAEDDTADVSERDVSSDRN